jgi:hypothetical protein
MATHLVKEPSRILVGPFNLLSSSASSVLKLGVLVGGSHKINNFLQCG